MRCWAGLWTEAADDSGFWARTCDLNFVAAKKNGFACSDRSGDDLPHPILIFVAAKGNGFACSGRCGSDLSRPILFFVAAKENGFAMEMPSFVH